jgi:hypothetical protein
VPLPRIGLNHLKPAFSRPSYQTLIPLLPIRHRNLLYSASRLSCWRWQRRDPPQHAPKEPARQTALRQ